MGLGDIGCMGQTKSFHIKILLLDKQELIQEVQVSFTFCAVAGSNQCLINV